MGLPDGGRIWVGLTGEELYMAREGLLWAELSQCFRLGEGGWVELDDGREVFDCGQVSMDGTWELLLISVRGPWFCGGGGSDVTLWKDSATVINLQW